MGKPSRRMSELVQGELSPEEALRLLEEVEQDPRLSRDLELQIGLQRIAHSPDGEVFRRPSVSSVRGWRSVFHWIWSGKRSLVPAGVVVALILAGVAALTVRSAGGNPFASLAVVTDEDVIFRLRSDSHAEVLAASSFIAERRYDEAADRFERHLRMYPGDVDAPWVHYAAGVVRLAGASRTWLGYLEGFDEHSVRQGLDHLEVVVADTSVPELHASARWYTSKGFLMLGDAASARGVLLKVVQEGGKWEEEARKVLKTIDESGDRP